MVIVPTLLISLSLLRPVLANPILAPFDDCFIGNATQKLNVSSVYAQITTTESLGNHLNLTVFGESAQEIVGYQNGSSDLSTLFSSTETLTFNVWNHNSYFCTTLRPPSPLPSPDQLTNTSCPIPAGPFAFSAAIPLGRSRELATLQTRFRAVDPFTNEILCVDIATTPLDPGAIGSVYGRAAIIFWFTVALAIAYWVIVGIARISTAWGRRAGWSGRGFLAGLENAGFVVASAISGEGLAKSPALIRYATPSMRDIFFHTQWCAALAMIAVQWPNFIYPLLSQTAWAALSYNITLTQDDSQHHWNPVSAPSFQPPSDFVDQVNDQTSPLFIDTTVPNILFTLPSDAKPGLSSFAYAVGLRPQDLFGVCMILFLAIIGGTIFLSLFVWAIDSLAALLHRTFNRDRQGAPFGARSPRYSSASKDMLDNIGSSQGMVLGRSTASLASIVLAAVSFAAFSVLIPFLLILRLSMTPTSKLYDETWTLLSLGPLYNHYRHGSQLFACLFFATSLAFGVTIGCGQKSGTAQAIIILVVEVISALVTSVWLPWGHGASMGLISFLFCVARIVIAVLLVSIGNEAGQWVAYVILTILALVYLAFVLMLLCKLIEALVRIFGGVGFDRSRHAVDAGLLGACSLAGCCGSRKHRTHRHRYKSSDLPQSVSQATFANSGTRKDATPTPSGPPSVLRPEHALRPYREESDDENGYIMGAWQPFPRPGYSAVNDQVSTPPLEPPKSGFSRVGGGRAHYDSPYAIASGSTQTFPSVERNSTPQRNSVDSTQFTPLKNTAERSFSTLPPGAMAPHVRKKSQSAVIENTPVLAGTSSSRAQDVDRPARRQSIHPEVVSPLTDDDVSEYTQPKKKHWFQRRKPRRHSDGDSTRPSREGIAPAPEGGGTSFVVVRNRRVSQPMASSSRIAADASEMESGAGASEPAGPQKSFVVIRGKDTQGA
ncbi:hypothetical protein HETIRDRAFT_34584 [Heterobasidion irregulare TC 32-1]|uniref:TRP C-terminal domain-containing protein n=1 Tax=Heterobasidion irregulare (strain TC 32-1) TaxID=747525 RepID=W4KE72_HETIT|nr:uncharacterized protein HETIRDRAFT_34584 [Heterobasidion irregulare TC 32-1]ETW84113.1 hypothetical protein HETIRDRAFT_34584 [Heterobasidion irregulare TC 32-1]